MGAAPRPRPGGRRVVADGDSLALADGVEVDARELDAALDRGDVAAAAELAERGELLRGFEDEWALAARDERRDRLGAALAAPRRPARPTRRRRSSGRGAARASIRSARAPRAT